MPSIVLPKLRRSYSMGASKDDTTRTYCESVSMHPSEELHVASKQAETECIKEVKDHFRKFGVRLPEEKVFRYACFHQFDAEDAIEAIREDNYNPYLDLKMEDLQGRFLSSSLFPLPHLRACKNSEVVYMRPSRLHPSDEGYEQIIESLCYVLNDLSQTQDQCRNGVTVIADMQDISERTFTKEHCRKFMKALQGEMVPTRVEAFLIVSPPSWFGKVWKWMKSAMSRDFAKRVHMIKEERLSEFLMDEFELYLPDELCSGLAYASEIAEDYVDLKMMQEQTQL